MKRQIILKNGQLVDLKQWQESRKLAPTNLSQYFLVEEFIDDEGELVISELLIDLLTAYRIKINRAIKINSAYRGEKTKARLIKQGLKVAKNSPHEHGFAADIDTATTEQSRRFAKDLLELAKEMQIMIRVGFQDYINKGQTFVHVDVAPSYCAKGMPYENEGYPSAYKINGLTW